MVESYNKTQYKIFLLLIKYLPFFIAVIYFISAICGCFGIQLIVIPNLFFMSPLTAGVWIFISFVFKCCVWHRLPIYYCMTLDTVTIIDYYNESQLTQPGMFSLCIGITLIFILLGMYFKNKYNVKRKRTKTSSS